MTTRPGQNENKQYTNGPGDLWMWQQLMWLQCTRRAIYGCGSNSCGCNAPAGWLCFFVLGGLPPPRPHQVGGLPPNRLQIDPKRPLTGPRTASNCSHMSCSHVHIAELPVETACSQTCESKLNGMETLSKNSLTSNAITRGSKNLPEWP